MQKIFKKSLSQNFLIDQNIQNKIINEIKINKDDILIELGAGDGAISKSLSTFAKKTILIEIDKNLIPKLQQNIYNDNTKIYNDDILKFDFKNIFKKYKKIRIYGNIPYKISSKLILLLTELKKNIKDIHLVIQKEMSDKLEKKQTSNTISILTEYHFKTIKIFDIKSNSFKPKPKIKSSFIKLIPTNNRHLIKYDTFKDLIKNSFKKKRKKISKSIKHIKNFQKYINVEKRAENINLKEFIRLSNLMTITRIKKD